MSTEFSVAHKYDDLNLIGQGLYPNGLVPWREAMPPDLNGGHEERSSGSLRACWYCGSMHPADVAAAIRAGAKGEWADMKYGWPHKAYFQGIPNPHAGMLESRMRQNFPPPVGQEDKWRRLGPREWAEVGKPAEATTYGKFYTVHLQDATPEDRATIEQHLGLSFEFLDDGRKVKWSRIEPSPTQGS